MHLEAVIERVWRCPRRPRLNELRDAVRGCSWVSFKMHLKPEVKWTERCTWWLWSSEVGDTLGRHDRMHIEMHLEAVIERVRRCTCSPIEQHWRSTGRRSMTGALGASTLFISQLTRNHGNVMAWLYLWAVMQSCLVAFDHARRHAISWSYIPGSTCNRKNEWKSDNLGWMLYLVYACTWCMLYLVYVVFSVNSLSWYE